MLNKKIKTVIKFGGFYESIHSDLIDMQIEDHIEYYNQENNTSLNYDDYDFNYKDMEMQYLKQYISNYQDFIESEYNLNINIDDINLYSPKEYNFKTDEIDCYILKSDENKLIKHFKKDNDFLEYLKNATQSYDGFYSYYSFDRAYNNENDILTLYIFEYIANKYQESDSFNTDIYIDISENQPELV
tara:strand:- start:352 stop:912 length:561 start_codon:yes stop_codon:yes gene_type:complete